MWEMKEREQSRMMPRFSLEQFGGYPGLVSFEFKMPMRYPSRNVKEAVGYIGQDLNKG